MTKLEQRRRATLNVPPGIPDETLFYIDLDTLHSEREMLQSTHQLLARILTRFPDLFASSDLACLAQQVVDMIRAPDFQPGKICLSGNPKMLQLSVILNQLLVRGPAMEEVDAEEIRRLSLDTQRELRNLQISAVEISGADGRISAEMSALKTSDEANHVPLLHLLSQRPVYKHDPCTPARMFESSFESGEKFRVLCVPVSGSDENTLSYVIVLKAANRIVGHAEVLWTASAPQAVYLRLLIYPKERWNEGSRPHYGIRALLMIMKICHEQPMFPSENIAVLVYHQKNDPDDYFRKTARFLRGFGFLPPLLRIGCIFRFQSIPSPHGS